jgi:excinuclease UvrABC ATPase subunit
LFGCGIIDLGSEEGGRIVARCMPEQVASVKKSYTGQALTGYFAGSGKRSAEQSAPK